MLFFTKPFLLWILASGFGIYSVILLFTTNFNAGNLLVWLISFALFIYAIFHSKIDKFCSNGWGRFFKYSFLGGSAIFVCLLLFVAISGYAHTATGNEKAIIILGSGIKKEQVSDILRRRLIAGKKAFEQNPDAILVVSGGMGNGEIISEAEAMKRWLIANGVPEHKIIMEDTSTSTQENLLFVHQILLEHGLSSDDSIAVVTNSFHLYRAEQYAKMAGFTNISTVPASMNISVILPSYMREVLPLLDLWIFKR